MTSVRHSTAPFLFEKALSIDSSLYAAYTAIANCYLLYNFYGRAPSSEVYPKVMEALKKSEAINNQSSELYAAKAAVALNFKFDKEAYEQFTKKAIELDGKNPKHLFQSGQLLCLHRAIQERA